MTTTAKAKALLIGISNDGTGNRLLGPKKDVLGMKELLTKTYGYKKHDIVVMHDKLQKEERKPTRDNILREIDHLVKDCHPGDRFVFHYSGHTGQQPNHNGTEADQKDERIQVMKGEYILDDELRRRLVDKLCPGSQLIAILDSCHSATLLDLPHVECHNPLTPHSGDSTKLQEEGTDVAIFGGYARLPSLRKIKPKLTLQLPKKIFTAFRADGPATSILPPDDSNLFASSPVSVDATSTQASPQGHEKTTDRSDFYLGGCFDCPLLQRDQVRRNVADLPMVLAISACTDAQLSWEDPSGNGMTKVLCGFLQRFPNPTLNRLHTEISFGLFEPAYVRAHSPKFLAVFKRMDPSDGANCYQHPSLSGLQRLNLNHELHL